MRLTLILFLVAILTPSTWECETWGVGEVMVLDAVFSRTMFAGAFYAIEWNSSSTMANVPDTIELVLPLIDAVTLIVWMIGILSSIVSGLALINRLDFKIGLLLILLSATILAIAPSINILRVEWAYNYRMQPLFVPQIVDSLVLIWYARTRRLGQHIRGLSIRSFFVSNQVRNWQWK